MSKQRKNNYLGILGLAFRARQCSTGEDTIIQDIQQNRAKLILIANDISETTKKKITDKCKTYHVPYMEVDDRVTLAHAIGKSERVAIAILDEGFAQKMLTLLS